MNAIRVSQLSKAYKQYPSRWARLQEWLAPRARLTHSLKWVLQEIDFVVEQGEVVGILGINGAGKSTLLKILAGTTQPTNGTVQIQGRVAALLELGMGFHPDFTGRQNALLSGQLMGLSTAAIQARFTELEAFAELGPYFDQPLRIYSSGMAVRLAFSVATLVRPDVLIVDEALAVGDAFFQVKCFARIREFKKLGTTILFVSHDVGTIKTLCDRAILISDGRVERDGDAALVSDYYSALIANRLVAEHIVQDISSAHRVTRSGTQEVEVVSVKILDASGEAKGAFFCGQRARIEVSVRIVQPIPRLVQGFLIRDRRGNDVYGTNTFHLDKVIINPNVGACYRIAFDFDVDLAEGVYSISVASVNSDTVLWQNFAWIENITMFQVVRATQPFFIGIASLQAVCKIDVIPANLTPLPP
jgi:lipopolysaccharide transport system ATP-binding protein